MFRGSIKAYGEIGLPSYTDNMLYIPESTKISIVCERGHKFNGIVANLPGLNCRICKTHDSLPEDTLSLSNEFTIFDFNFKFQCTRGHKFIANNLLKDNGCRCCQLQQYINNFYPWITMDCDTYYKNTGTLIRFCCSKKNYGHSHDVEFYASYKQAKYSKLFDNCRWMHFNHRVDQIKLLRVFEYIFDAKFNEFYPEDGIELDCYNKEAAIACINGDTDSDSTKLARATEWSSKNNVKLFVIYDIPPKTKYIVPLVCKQAKEMGMDIPEDEVIREGLRDLELREGKMFKNRIENQL